MPLQLGLKATDKVFGVGLDDNNNPIGLVAGQQVATITSSDPATITITPDPSALPTDAAYKLLDGTPVPAGSVTQASATVSVTANPAQPNVAISVTLHVANTDGTPVLDDTGAVIADVVDTVTYVPALPQLKKEGELFGTPA